MYVLALAISFCLSLLGSLLLSVCPRFLSLTSWFEGALLGLATVVQLSGVPSRVSDSDIIVPAVLDQVHTRQSSVNVGWAGSLNGEEEQV